MREKKIGASTKKQRARSRLVVARRHQQVPFITTTCLLQQYNVQQIQHSVLYILKICFE
jgi:hypothetical protein